MDMTTENIRSRIEKHFQGVSHRLKAEDIHLDMPPMDIASVLPSVDEPRFQVAPGHYQNIIRLQEQVDQLNKELQSERTRQTVVEKQVELKYRRQLEEMEKAYAELLEKSKGMEQELTDVRTRLGEARREVDSLRREMQKKDEALASYSSVLSEADKVRQRYEETCRHLNSTQGELTQLKETLKSKEDEIRSVSRSLDASSPVQGELDDLRMQLDHARQDYAILQTEMQAKEAERTLFQESAERLGRENKELLASIRKMNGSDTLSTEEAPAASADQLKVLEQAVSERDRLLEDREAEFERQKQEYEWVIEGSKKSEEQARVQAQQQEQSYRDLEARFQQLLAENETLKTVPSGNVPEEVTRKLADLEKELAEKAAGLQQALDRETGLQAKLDEHLLNVVTLKKKKTELEGALQEKASETQQAVSRLASLEKKYEELETQNRLLLLNTESIEKMEHQLRETYRLMCSEEQVREMVVSKKKVGIGPMPVPTSKPGLWFRFVGWWKKPLVSFKKKSTAASAAKPPAVQPALRTPLIRPGLIKRPPR
ncbi:MAG TPA: hypothetical protein PK876_03060 [Elusimicrobiota bacterium]|nr:hypothetical protein [Elusimicrobiota bacterium]